MSIIGAILYFLGCVAAGGAAGFAAGSTIAWAIGKIIDTTSLKDEVKEKCPNALKILIREKKKMQLMSVFLESMKSAFKRLLI